MWMIGSAVYGSVFRQLYIREGFSLYPVLYMKTVEENCRSNAAVLYCNNITKKEEES